MKRPKRVSMNNQLDAILWGNTDTQGVVLYAFTNSTARWSGGLLSSTKNPYRVLTIIKRLCDAEFNPQAQDILQKLALERLPLRPTQDQILLHIRNVNNLKRSLIKVLLGESLYQELVELIHEQDHTDLADYIIQRHLNDSIQC